MVPDGGSRSPPTFSSPRERILRAARELFYRYGIHCVAVDAIALAAETNKMTLYRHFASKDHLIAECMRELAAEFDLASVKIEKKHFGDPKRQLLAWLHWMISFGATNRLNLGCALTNAAIELPDRHHPARRIIEQHKLKCRDKLVLLCRTAGMSDPELAADELFLLCEGARVSVASIGQAGPMKRLRHILEAVLKRYSL